MFSHANNFELSIVKLTLLITLGQIIIWDPGSILTMQFWNVNELFTRKSPATYTIPVIELPINAEFGKDVPWPI